MKVTTKPETLWSIFYEEVSKSTFYGGISSYCRVSLSGMRSLGFKMTMILLNSMVKSQVITGLGVHVGDSIICTLAYADDIALIADTPENLQKLLDVTYNWCNKWRFMINPSKSNVVHYRNPPKAQTNFKFSLGTNGPKLDIVTSYKYLGVYLDQYLTFSKATEVLGNAAGRALGSMINKYKSMKEMGYSTYTVHCLNHLYVR